MKHPTNWYLDFDGEKIADHYAWNVDESAPEASLDATFRRLRRDLEQQAAQFSDPFKDVNFTRAVEKVVARTRGSLVRHLASLHPCSFKDFLADPKVNYVLSEIAPPSASPNQVAVTAQQIYHFAARHKYQRVYQVTDGLGQRLEATDLHGLRGADVRLPHPAIQILLPQSTTLQFHNHLTGLHRLHSVYLIEHPGNAENHRVWRMLLVGVAKGRDMRSTATKEPDDALLFFDIDFLDDEPIEESIAREQRKLADYVTKAPWLSADVKKSYCDGTWIRIFNYLRNVVLYTTASDVRSILAPEVEALKTKFQRTKKARTDPKLAARWRSLGRRVILGHDMEPLERNYAHKQVLVSGHFRNQPCGPQHSQLKRIFIQPYWRNLDAEEASITTQTRL